MNTFDLDRAAVRYWTVTGSAGFLVTTAAALLLAGTASATTPPAWQPIDPDLPTTVVTVPNRPEPTHTCFISRHDWPTEAVGPMPRCTVAQRTSGTPASTSP